MRVRALGLLETFDDAVSAVAGPDLVVLAVPVGAVGAAAAAIATALKHGALVTDTGSVKRAVIAAVSPHLPEHVVFVPGRPLAGTEHSGSEAGFATLFKGRWQILTPLDDTAEGKQAVIDLGEFWEKLGAHVDVMDPERHDVVLAVTSHLPHLIAFNIVAMAEDLESVTESEVVKYSASGFRDFTRIAASDPTMLAVGKVVHPGVEYYLPPGKRGFSFDMAPLVPGSYTVVVHSARGTSAAVKVLRIP